MDKVVDCVEEAIEYLNKAYRDLAHYPKVEKWILDEIERLVEIIDYNYMEKDW